MPEAKNLENIWVLDNTTGRIVIELDPVTAPLHTERMQVLTRDGFYDGILWHRVIEGFVAQAGDPQGTGFGGSDLPDLPLEPSEIPHVRGAVSMARAGNDRDSGNSQFFIVQDDATFLDGDFSLFGQVLVGMNAADALPRVEPNLDSGFYENPAGEPTAPGRIERAQIAADATPVAGTEGDDSITLQTEALRVDLGGGNDVVTIAGNAADFTIEGETGSASQRTTIYGQSGAFNVFVEFQNVETLQFDDQTVDLVALTGGDDPAPEPEPAPELATPNRIILSGDSQNLSVGFNADIVGTAAGETVTVADGATARFTANTGDRLEFGQPASAYQVAREGINGLIISDSANQTTATLTLNNPATMAFADGQATVEIGAGDSGIEISIGGETVNDGFDLSTVSLSALADDPNNGSSAGNTVLLSGVEQTLLLSFSGQVVGTAAAETIQVANGRTVSLAGNTGDRVEFDIALTDATITREGINGLVVETAGGGRITISLNNPVTLAFTNGSATAEIGVVDSVVQLSLGGQVINESFDAGSVALDSQDAASFGSGGGVAGESTGYWEWLG